MIQLNKKYRIIWDLFTLNIQSDHTTDYSGSITRLVNPDLKFGYFESDNLQDILDKISSEQLNTIGNWVDYDI